MGFRAKREDEGMRGFILLEVLLAWVLMSGVLLLVLTLQRQAIQSVTAVFKVLGG